MHGMFISCMQDSLDSVEALIKKHQDFEKSLAPQGEKLNALEVFSQKLLAEGHYESEAVVTRRNTVVQRYVCDNYEIQEGKGHSKQDKLYMYAKASSFSFSNEKVRTALVGIRTHDTLQSRRALYQLSYQSNSAGRGSNLQHYTTQMLKKLNHCNSRSILCL